MPVVQFFMSTKRDTVQVPSASTASPSAPLLGLRKGTLVGLLDDHGDEQTVISLIGGVIGRFPRDAFERNEQWFSLDGQVQLIEAGPCGPEAKVPILGANLDDKAWAWVDDRPCPAVLKPVPVQVTPPEEDPYESRPDELVRTGQTVEIDCPDIALPNADKSAVVAAKGLALVLGLAGEADARTVRVSIDAFAGEVAPSCGVNGSMVVADFSPKAKVPKADGEAIVVHFWATWCAPCLKELPAYQRFVDRVGRDRTYAVSEDFELEKAHKYLAKHGLTFPGGLDNNLSVISALGGNEALPYTVVLLPNGRKWTKLGVIDWDLDGTIHERMGLILPPSSTGSDAQETNGDLQKVHPPE